MIKSKLTALDKKAQKALRSAVRKIVEQHKRTGIPLAVWKNGKVEYIAPPKMKSTTK